VYRSTRERWRQIWDDESDVAREAGTLSYRRARQIWALYARHLPQGEPVLEAGCGLGREVIRLEARGYRAVGVDYAENALHRIQAYRRGYRLAAGDVHHLPFPAGAFGSYLSFGVLEHFDFGPVPALREANRVLRRDGVLVLMIPYPNWIWRWVHRRKRPVADPVFFETTYTVRRLASHLAAAGFQIVERHPVGHSFTLWGLGGPFRAAGYYQTSLLAEGLGEVVRRILPWPMCFESLIIARKADAA
jgi:SAM-dependent methyltransferase